MEDKKLGYLALCADRRFNSRTMEAFAKASGLSFERGEIWIEAIAGGTAGI